MTSAIALLRSARAGSPASVQYQPPDPCRYDFFQGQPDPGAYPVAELRAAFNAVFDDEGITACKYQGAGGRAEMAYGFVGLREEIARLLNARDAVVSGSRALDASNVMVVNGSSQGLSLAVSAFIDPGDGVILEQASFGAVLGYLQQAGAEVRTVPMDRDGMDLDALVARLTELKAAGHRVKLVYTIATFQLPTGSVLSLERRQRLIALAREWDFMILEDNCYYAFHFDAPPPPTLLALDLAQADGGGRVLQSDSCSKTIAPGLRIGWMAGHPDALKALAAVRQDLGVSQITTRALARYLASGSYAPNVEHARLLLKQKRDAGVAALRKHCGQWVTFDTPPGGIYFWLEMSEAIDWPKVPAAAAAEGIALRAGELFSNDPRAERFVRLAWAHMSIQDIEDGIALFGKVLARCAGK